MEMFLKEHYGISADRSPRQIFWYNLLRISNLKHIFVHERKSLLRHRILPHRRK